MLVSVDAQGLEWRVIVWLSNDPIGIQELNEGLDIHTRNQQTFGLPSRLISKIYLFRTIYRGSGWAFANDPDFIPVSNDPAYWDNINTLFYNKYKGIDKCHKLWSNLVSQNKPIVSPLGREWFIPLKDDGTIHWPMMTNYPVQGSGNDLISIARVSLRRRLKKLPGLETKMISTIHDSIVLDVSMDSLELVSTMMIEVFNDIPKNVEKLFGIKLPIAFPGEVKIGETLKDMHKWTLK